MLLKQDSLDRYINVLFNTTLRFNSAWQIRNYLESVEPCPIPDDELRQITNQYLLELRREK